MRLLLALVLLLPAADTVGGSFEADLRAVRSEVRSIALAQPPAEIEAEEAIPGDLIAAAARWNTGAQLARLSPLAASNTLKFAVLGDVEPGRFIWSRVLFGRKGVFAKHLDLLADEDAAFVLQLGDMVSLGNAKQYRRFYKDLDDSDLEHPYLTTIGNHDRRTPHGDPDSSYYEALFGPRDYAFDAGGVRFISLDTSLERLTPGQLAWLDTALSTGKRKIIYTHMPPVSFKSWTVGMTGIKEGGEAFVSLVTRHRVDRVYMGHIHGFGIAQKDGVRYVLSGGGGSPLYWLPSKDPKLFYHYVTVQVTPESISETVHPLEGEPFSIAWPDAKKGDFDLLVKQ